MLNSPRFKGNSELQNAARNRGVLKVRVRGDAVALLQAGLIAVGFKMPISTAMGSKKPDGIFGEETQSCVRGFQSRERLSVDGIAGRNTLHRLDALVFPDKQLTEVAETAIALSKAILLDSKRFDHLLDDRRSISKVIRDLEEELNDWAGRGRSKRFRKIRLPKAGRGQNGSGSSGSLQYKNPAVAVAAPVVLILIVLLLLIIILREQAARGGHLPGVRLPVIDLSPPDASELLSELALAIWAMTQAIARQLNDMVNAIEAELLRLLQPEPCQDLLNSFQSTTNAFRHILRTIFNGRRGNLMDPTVFNRMIRDLEATWLPFLTALRNLLDCMEGNGVPVGPIRRMLDRLIQVAGSNWRNVLRRL